MSTVAGTTHTTQLGHDVVNMVEKLREHIADLADASTRTIKVRTYDDVVHSATFINAGKHHRITPHGLVEKKAWWRRTSVLGRHSVCMMSNAELHAIRLMLVGLISQLKVLEESTV